MREIYDIRIEGHFTVEGPAHWDPDAYEQAVESVLRHLHGSRVGRIVLDELGGSDVLILPRGEHAAQQACAMAIAEDSIPQGHFPRAVVGSFVQLEYTPGQWPSVASLAPRGMAGFRRDAVLLHELVHAVDQAAGLDRQNMFARTAYDFTSESERRAVRVTNMYRAEHHRPLRASYGDVAPLNTRGAMFREQGLEGLEPGRSPMGYRRGHWVSRTEGDPQQDATIRNEVELALRYMVDHPFLTSSLEALPRHVSWYNPFRDARLDRPPYVLVPGSWRPPVNLDAPPMPGDLA